MLLLQQLLSTTNFGAMKSPDTESVDLVSNKHILSFLIEKIGQSLLDLH